MNLRFYDFKTLEEEIQKLPSIHRIAFAASCCERLLPNYNVFSRTENWGNPLTLRKALTEVWQILQGKPLDVVMIQHLKDEINRNDVFPHSDDFSGYVGEAQYACSAILYTLSACENSNNLSEIINAVERVAFTLESFNDWDESLGSKNYLEAIAKHPFTVREMAKQSEDLQRLKEVETLDREFLEWPRTSSYNNGKSLIDLS
jgi:uncharacterized protein YjaG (DUF416 family)